MVIARYILFVLIALATSLRGETSLRPGVPRLKIEFSKNPVFAGEQVLANFVVYAPDDLVEIEVAKFPEFRGFLKENLILRQGIMSTSSLPNRMENQVVIGSYAIVPIQGEAEYQIEPMKAVAKSPRLRRIEGSTPPEFIFSEGSPLKVNPLPPFPGAQFRGGFSGAVGRFSTFSGDSVVSFQPNEPTVFRLSLQGTGNFQELSALPVQFPPSVEVLSQNTYSQSNAPFGMKTFEFTLRVNSEQDFEVLPVEMVYFDPDQGRYRALQSSSISFRFQKPTTELTKETFTPRGPEELRTGWTKSSMWSRSPSFWAMQLPLLFVSVFLLLSGVRFHREVKTRAPTLRSRLEEAKSALSRGEIDSFFRLASALARDRLKTAGEKELANEATWVIQKSDESRFSPAKTSDASPERLLESLRRLVN